MKVKLKSVSNHRLSHLENCIGELEFLQNNVFVFNTEKRKLTSTAITEVEEFKDYIVIHTINTVFSFKKKS